MDADLQDYKLMSAALCREDWRSAGKQVPNYIKQQLSYHTADGGHAAFSSARS
jgi:hypothetical protein